MTGLTAAIERIMNWLQQYQPEFAASFLPGLTREQIQEQTKDLPGLIPEEIYELYQYRNGTLEEMKSTVYPVFHFLPLDEAVQIFPAFFDPHETDYSYLYENKCLFPFLRDNCSHCAVLLDEHKQLSSPVVDIADDGDISLMYQSLTSMMLTIADYLETGVCYLDDEGFLVTDEKDKQDEKMIEIFLKYNPGIRFIW
ncbi:SMI1/KNR4 family protein [Nostoc sp. FACHB-152]|uniref:SMI1/KNR4 family protein n=1 Tax=unclassified Nostoc TaxID=2593658 RepID=UPI001687B190|nr:MULTISPECIES: SMI1/KNR4 family protein [unclassified Nostoc]MBD2450776.1 SMI1/KNR4 family protein [Nostoc sp. FACHB-152]MBD2470251.1 SMI1/KNR4 family protein [Nostoc sp. FACHB-145]